MAFVAPTSRIVGRLALAADESAPAPFTFTVTPPENPRNSTFVIVVVPDTADTSVSITRSLPSVVNAKTYLSIVFVKPAVSIPAPPSIVSLPPKPTSVLLPELPMRTLASELPVPLTLPLPWSVRFSTLAGSVYVTAERTVSLPSFWFSAIVSAVDCTTNVSLPVPPTNVLLPPVPPTR